ncbi:MAG: hypothetical protein WC341_16860 [Bacteroidales bacterium]|jgi:hypothetical protein
MSTLKEGSKVTIRSKKWFEETPKDEDGDITSVPFMFCDRMAQHCGKKAKIVAVKKDAKDELTGIVSDAYKLDIDNGFWTWSEPMFEPIEPKKASKRLTKKS